MRYNKSMTTDKQNPTELRDFCFEENLTAVEVYEIAIDLAYMDLCELRSSEALRTHAVLLMELDALKQRQGV